MAELHSKRCWHCKRGGQMLDDSFLIGHRKKKTIKKKKKTVKEMDYQEPLLNSSYDTYLLLIFLNPKPSLQAGFDTGSIFKWSTAA